MCPLVGVVGVWVVRRGAGARQLELVQGLHTSHSLTGRGGEERGRGGEGRGPCTYSMFLTLAYIEVQYNYK